MENKTTKQIVIGAGIGIGILILLVGVSAWNGKKGKEEGEINQKTVENGLEQIEGGTREKISEKIKTPEPGDKSKTEDVAIPTLAFQVDEKTQSSLRKFEIAVKGNAYVPSTIVVNEQDLLELVFLASDKDYDVFFPDMGIYKKLSKGEKATIEFQANPYGSYTFFCKEACVGEVRGSLIVN